MDKNDFKTLSDVARFFKISGNIIDIEKYGNGHINDTFLVRFDENGNIKKYILQRISKRMTNDVPALMRNVELVTDFIYQKTKQRGGDPEREGLVLVRTLEDKVFYYDGTDYYRMYVFIDYATCYQSVTDPKYFYEAAVAFGNFANLLSEFDATQLTDTIPNFHNTKMRYNAFLKAVESDEFNRASEVKREIQGVKSRLKYSTCITSLLDSGLMPYRVTHNDTKLNNVMIDDATKKGIAIIDLDTVMQGSLCYDFGDSIRFGCNSADESEKDLTKVLFNIDLFEVYAKGYLSAVNKSITKIERDNLAMGAIVMTYECGMRFLTDYLQGDVYFHTTEPKQNLDRARTQLKLVEEMEKHYNELLKIVDKY